MNNTTNYREGIDNLIVWYRNEDRSLPIEEVGEAINAFASLCDAHNQLIEENERLEKQLAEWQNAFVMFKGTPKELADWAVKDAAKLQELGRKSVFLQ